MTAPSQGADVEKTPLIVEKLEQMQSDLADLARKLNIEGEHEGALAVQQAIVAMSGAVEAASPYGELEWDWVHEPTTPRE